MARGPGASHSRLNVLASAMARASDWTSGIRLLTAEDY